MFPVIDRTGLKGRYDFKLEWAQDLPASLNAPESEKPAANSPASFNESIFGALQEQLGLKLEPHKGLVESLFIVTAEKPSAN